MSGPFTEWLLAVVDYSVRTATTQRKRVERLQRKDAVKHQEWHDTGDTLLGFPIMERRNLTEEQQIENAVTRHGDSN